MKVTLTVTTRSCTDCTADENVGPIQTTSVSPYAKFLAASTSCNIHINNNNKSREKEVAHTRALTSCLSRGWMGPKGETESPRSTALAYPTDGRLRPASCDYQHNIST